MKRLFLLFILLANQVFAQDDRTEEITTQIQDVTVFLSGAQITRKGDIKLKPGRSIILLKSLSPHIDAKSIQVKGTGDFTILSVNHAFNYLDELENDDKVDSLIEITKSIESKIETHNYRLSVLNEKISLLNVNKKLGNETSHISITDLKDAVDFYDQTLMNIKTEELNLKNKLFELNTELAKIRNQIGDLQNFTGEPTGEISIHVEAEAPVSAHLTIDYIVANAGWFPKYDLRVKDVESPLQLTYKAELHQNTGVDWKNVKLKFSNGNPNQSGVAPELTTWYLNYQRNTRYQSAGFNQVLQGAVPGISVNVRSVFGTVFGEDGEPLPGVNVVVKGTTVGTVTDLNGNYNITLPNSGSELVFSYIGYVTEDVAVSGSTIDIQMIEDIAQLSEVVVTGYSASGRERFPSLGPNTYKKPEVAKNIITTMIENQTTVEFEVEKPYSLKSNGKNLTVKLNTYEIETLYEYYAVPKLDKDAFLIARIINWDQFNLLEGEANLYFEDAFVGRSILDAKALTDTLDISLGRDRNIVLGREKIDTFTKRTSLGANKLETRGFRIIARNKKSNPIHLTIFDQIPVSAISPIEVTPKKLSEGLLNEATGEVTWVLDIPSNNQVELEMEYEVKYPKREKVILE
jgi:hypothetical protein